MNNHLAVSSRAVLVSIDHIRQQIAHELGCPVTEADATAYLKSIGLTPVDDHWAEMQVVRRFPTQSGTPDDQQRLQVA